MNSRETIRAIQEAGWEHVGTTGDHWQFRHPRRPGRVTVPHLRWNLLAGTPRSTKEQSGVELR